MVKRKYNATTGELGKAYPDSMVIPAPFLTLTNEENDNISTDTEHIYFYIDGELEAKNKAEIEQKNKRKEEIKVGLNELDLKSIRAIRSNDTTYIQMYEAQAAELRSELANL